MFRRSVKTYLLAKGLLVFALSLVLVIGLVPVQTAGIVRAQSGLIISTSYPGVTVRPGETAEFPLEILNTGLASQKVNVAVVSQPEGWETSLEGRGKPVHQVFAHRGEPQHVDLRVVVPAEVEEGTYQVVVRAWTGSVASTLTLDLKVDNQEGQTGKLEAQYPQLQGPAGATFKFRVNLTNDTTSEQSYSLAAHAPQGWQVSFSPAYDSKKIASLSLRPGQSQGLDVDIIPAQEVKAGKYTISVSAISAAGTLSTDLEVIITGTYELKLTTPTGRLNAEAYAGREREVTLLVENNGSADLRGIRFSSWEPRNWSVRFEPEKLEHLPAGESAEIKAYIKPDRRAITGDYVVSLRATTPETSSSLELRVLVKTSTLWGIIGLAIVLAVIAGVLRMFQLYGRR